LTVENLLLLNYEWKQITAALLHFHQGQYIFLPGLLNLKDTKQVDICYKVKKLYAIHSRTSSYKEHEMSYFNRRSARAQIVCDYNAACRLKAEVHPAP